MSIIDVRSIKPEVTSIVFADNSASDAHDVALKLTRYNIYPASLFLENGEGDSMAVRRKDIPYLIKALQAAQDLWEGCK
jgi:hypothetical protein